MNNLANYCSGFGFHLYDTCDSTFADNYADYCCRYYLSEASSHLGADAAGFLIVYKSCNNIFRKNYARLSGDGFFLAGLTPDGIDGGCNHNLFEENDASYSPNNAFEGVFSRGNIYRGNKANHSNYGFWLGFSSDCILTNNQIYSNRQAGIAVENGVHFKVMDNDIQNNGVRALKEEPLSISPKNHSIQNNEIRDNNIRIELEKAKDTQKNGNS